MDSFSKMIWFWRFCLVKLCKLFRQVSPKHNIFLWLKRFNILLGLWSGRTKRRDRAGQSGTLG